MIPGKKLKIIVAGEWYADIYEKAMAEAFSSLGHEVIPFRVAGFFKDVIGAGATKEHGLLKSAWYKFQYKYIVGPSVKKLNTAFEKLVEEEMPDLVFIYRGNYFYPSTIRHISNNGFSKIVVYNNDDPFGKGHPFYLWRYFIKGLAFYHHVFSYREKNIRDYAGIGIYATSLLRSYYRVSDNYPMTDIADSRFINDVCFIGHYEDDGRDEKLKYLLDHGVQLNIYGTLWERSKHHDQFVERMGGPIKPLFQDYNLCINSNRICLVFLSKKNNDTYTRRCFEIPAANAFMLSEYTDDLNDLFTADTEAVYFNSKETLLEKTNFYINHPAERKKIADAGYERLRSDGHEVSDRAKQVLETFYKIAD